MRSRLAILLILLCLVASCDNHSFRTDETTVAGELIGRCFEMRLNARVYALTLPQDRRPDRRDTIADSFKYDGHFVVWAEDVDYGLKVPIGARFVVEKVLATHYPYPKNTVIYIPYVRLDAERQKLLVAANALFGGPNGYPPQPNPVFLGACD